MKCVFYISVGCILLSCIACVDPNAESTAMRDQIVAEGVQIRIAEFRQRAWDNCVEQARGEAVAEVDSIIRALAKYNAVEPVDKPPKSARPEKPETKVLPDSLKNKNKRE